MKILLTGATGYIGKRLLPMLLEAGHTVVCSVRDKNRFHYSGIKNENLIVVESDFLEPDTLITIPKDIDAAYYLIHSLAVSSGSFDILEAISATNFRNLMDETSVKQVIYLSGIVNEKTLSKHLSSRKRVEDILRSGKYATTTLRSGIIVGSGSASFEIIRDLVEKLPIIIAPKWLRTRSQPISIRNVIQFLCRVLGDEYTYHNSFDIGGPNILTYKEMLKEFARIRGLKRWIITLPFMTPRLSSYWLYYITSTSYIIVHNLVQSMKIEVICKPNNLAERLKITLISYSKALTLAFDKIEQQQVISSWKDALASGILNTNLTHYINVPTFGCFFDKRQAKLDDADYSLEKIWSIGGENGWYHSNWLWAFRGFIDKMFGGVGLRRGRKMPNLLEAGDPLDFWRVLLADKEKKRLLLFAEMKLPGEAWLEFKIGDNNILHQTATFRPRGILGRIYWYSVLPFHRFIFPGMIRKIAKKNF